VTPKRETLARTLNTRKSMLSHVGSPCRINRLGCLISSKSAKVCEPAGGGRVRYHLT
jgi:hypothetical protein